MRCSLLVLSHYLDQELDPRRAGELEAHLVGCRRCTTGLDNIRREAEQVGALARVRIPDYSALSLLQSLGLIPPDGDLPDPGHGEGPPDLGGDDELPAWMNVSEPETEVSGQICAGDTENTPVDAELRGQAAPSAVARRTSTSHEARA